MRRCLDEGDPLVAPTGAAIPKGRDNLSSTSGRRGITQICCALPWRGFELFRPANAPCHLHDHKQR